MFALIGNKLVIYIVAGMAFLGAVSTIYIVWKTGIENAAIAEQNENQLKQIIKAQQEEIAKQKQILDDQEATIKKATADNQALNQRIESITTYLNSDTVKKEDKPSSDILRNTIQELQEGNVK